VYKITATYNGTEVIIHGSKMDPSVRISQGTLKEFVNTIPTFSFVIYPDNPGYEIMHDLLTGITVYDRRANETIFSGRVYSVADVMTDSGLIYKTVTCEGTLAYLCDTIQPHRSYTGQPTRLEVALPAILTTHNNKVGARSGKQIQIGEVSGGFGPYESDYISTFNVIKEISDLAGADFRIRYENDTRYLDCNQSLGELSSTVIELGVNLKSLQRNVEAKDIVTRFYPLGINRDTGGYFTIASVNQGSDFLANNELANIYGVTEAVKIYNDITIKDASAVSTGAAKLKAAGQRDYNKMIGLLTSFSIQAVDLSFINGNYESLKMYNTYRVKTSLQGIDETVRLTGRTLSLDEPQNPTLTFGQKQSTLTSLVAGK